jgi:hypothetical protein
MRDLDFDHPCCRSQLRNIVTVNYGAPLNCGNIRLATIDYGSFICGRRNPGVLPIYSGLNDRAPLIGCIARSIQIEMESPNKSYVPWHVCAYRVIATRRIPIDRDHPFRAIAIRLWTGATGTVG